MESAGLRSLTAGDRQSRPPDSAGVLCACQSVIPRNRPSARMQEVIQRQLAPVDINGQGANSVIDPSLVENSPAAVGPRTSGIHKVCGSRFRDGYETLPEYLDEYLPAATLGTTALAGRPDRVAVRRTGTFDGNSHRRLQVLLGIERQEQAASAIVSDSGLRAPHGADACEPGRKS